MPRVVAKGLTARFVDKAPAGRHADGNGLYLLVSPSGARSWLFRYMVKGKSYDMGLGAAGRGGVGLSDARNMALEARQLLRQGRNPLEERRKQQAALEAESAAKQTCNRFETEALAYIAMHEDSWRNAKHRQQWRNTLATYAYPVIGDVDVNDVTTEHVLQILQPIWKAKPETASRLRGRLEQVLDAAKARGLRQGDNPARWRGHLQQLLSAPKKLYRGHHAALPYPDMPAFMAGLRAKQGVSALALEFTILTAARSGEVLQATWDEVDLEKAIWEVSASRMKAGKAHRAPLSPRAMALLTQAKVLDSRYLFPNTKSGPLSSMAMAMMLRRMGHEAITVHGFRSTFRDWAEEETDYAGNVCEMALAHSIGNRVEAAYRRGDLLEKRRALMADWATYLEGKSA